MDLQSRLAALPAVHILQRHPAIHTMASSYPSAQIVAAIREILQEARETLRNQTDEPVSPLQFEADTLVERVIDRLECERMPGYRPVINGSGILFHPDAGEAPIGEPVRSTMAHMLISTICDDLDQVEKEICTLTGAEDAVIVTSAQAAFFLMMKVLCDGKDVVVARSHLGMRENGFRPIQAMAHAGARVIEIGATNKTHPEDYQAAIGEQTGAIGVIRPTTYALRGFTQDVALQELVQLGAAVGVPVVYDAGYTTLKPLPEGLWQPSISLTEAVRYGVSVTIVRADGLIGGPACGLIIGCNEVLDKVRRHALMPMLTPSPLLRAGLKVRMSDLKGATDDFEGHPAAYMLTVSLETIRQRADTLCAGLKTGESVEIIERPAFLTPYKLPAESLPSCALSFRPPHDAPDTVLARWRNRSPALLGIHDGDRILLDMRGIKDEQIEMVAQIVNDG